jgi:hypothetical protein
LTLALERREAHLLLGWSHETNYDSRGCRQHVAAGERLLLLALLDESDAYVRRVAGGCAGRPGLRSVPNEPRTAGELRLQPRLCRARLRHDALLRAVAGAP